MKNMLKQAFLTKMFIGLGIKKGENMNPKGYRCANCGNMLSISEANKGILRCDCCGSEYRINDEITPLMIESIPYKYRTIGSRVEIPREYLFENSERIFELSLHEMARNMADKLVPLMSLEVSYDPMKMEHILYGNIKVAVPDTPPEKVLRNAVTVNPGIVKSKGE